MPEFVPVSVRALERLIRQAQGAEEKFSRDLAVAHLTLDLQQGARKTQRQYAEFWGWSKSTVDRNWSGLVTTAENLLAETPQEIEAEYIEPQAEEENVELKFDKESWQHEYAHAFAEQLGQEGVVVRDYLLRPERTLQRYADIFDKLHRIDGHKQETIRDVVNYLFREDDWWIRTGNIASATKLRQKLRNSDQYVFDRLLHQMNTQRNGEQGSVRARALRDSVAETFHIIQSRTANG